MLFPLPKLLRVSGVDTPVRVIGEASYDPDVMAAMREVYLDLEGDLED